MRISDWSSDGCSSDLVVTVPAAQSVVAEVAVQHVGRRSGEGVAVAAPALQHVVAHTAIQGVAAAVAVPHVVATGAIGANHVLAAEQGAGDLAPGKAVANCVSL